MTAKIIFVLSEGRTGSTLLCKLLSGYKKVIEIAEGLHGKGANLLRPLHIGSNASDPNASIKHNMFGQYLREKYDNNSILNDVQFQRKLLEDPVSVISEISSHFTETVVLKIHLDQINILKHLDWILLQPNHKFILLERPNYLDVYVSSQIAIQTHRYHMSNTNDVKIKIDCEDFAKQLGWYRMKYNNISSELQNHSIDYLKLDYNKDLKNYNLDKFTDLISPWRTRTGIDLQLNELVKVNLDRQNNNKSSFENILNYEELLEFIKKLDLDIDLKQQGII